MILNAIATFALSLSFTLFQYMTDGLWSPTQSFWALTEAFIIYFVNLVNVVLAATDALDDITGWLLFSVSIVVFASL